MALQASGSETPALLGEVSRSLPTFPLSWVPLCGVASASHNTDHVTVTDLLSTVTGPVNQTPSGHSREHGHAIAVLTVPSVSQNNKLSFKGKHVLKVNWAVFQKVEFCGEKRGWKYSPCVFAGRHALSVFGGCGAWERRGGTHGIGEGPEG